jgi:uncharacterized membrane protein YqjE
MNTLASWAALAPDERKARLRALAGLAQVFAGPAAAELVALLRAAEDDTAGLEAAAAALAALPALPMRRALSVMVRLCRTDREAA